MGLCFGDNTSLFNEEIGLYINGLYINGPMFWAILWAYVLGYFYGGGDRRPAGREKKKKRFILKLYYYYHFIIIIFFIKMLHQLPCKM